MKIKLPSYITRKSYNKKKENQNPELSNLEILSLFNNTKILKLHKSGIKFH